MIMFGVVCISVFVIWCGGASLGKGFREWNELEHIMNRWLVSGFIDSLWLHGKSM